ncbi:Ubiquitin carboxyl-terminal hydrolase isozyme L3, partial [Modicella reniformis]
YVRDLGVQAPWRYVDVLGLDEELLAFVPQPVHALILLFPTTDTYNEFCKNEAEVRKDEKVSSNVVLYRQTIANACGTMGVLHSIANNWGYNESLKLKENSIMDNFLKRSLHLSTPEERAAVLEEDKSFAGVHEVHASTGQTETPNLQDEVNLHFVCLIERDGSLYELDGNKKTPINHGTTTKDTFLIDAIKIAQVFMSRDPDNINFSVIAATTAEDD